MTDSVAEIKARLRIEDVVGTYVQLKKVGRNFKGLCPFHNEKTPSFHVSVEKQLAYCFGCQKGGDLFKFVEEIEHCDFKEALERLAERAGVSLPERHPVTPGVLSAQPQIPRRDVKKTLFDLHNQAADFFVEQLWKTDAGTKVRLYLEKRGLNEATIREFRIGFAPQSDHALSQAMLEAGFSKEVLLQSGLVIARDFGDQQLKDRFSLRLMFPIFDLQGRVVAFGGRVLAKDDQPKYLNSPETPIYHKSSLLYGLHAAKAHIRTVQSAVVVEGYMDMLASYQADVKNVVASSGTALTVEQLQLIKRFTSKVIFAFDADQAGQLAMHRAIALGLTSDIMMDILQIPEGKDPADTAHMNPEAWRNAVLSAKPFWVMLCELTCTQEAKKTPEGLRMIRETLFPLLAQVSHAVDRDLYLKDLATALSIRVEQLYDDFSHYLRGQRRVSVAAKKNGDLEKSIQYSAAEYLLGLLFCHPGEFAVCADRLTPLHFPSTLSRIYQLCQESFSQNGSVQTTQILSVLNPEERVHIERLIMYADIRHHDLSEEHLRKESQEVVTRVIAHGHRERKERLLADLRAAQQSGNQAEETRLFTEYTQFLRQIA